MQQASDMTLHHFMSGDVLAGVVSRCIPRGLGLGFGGCFSHDGCVFVLQSCYQHPMPNQQHQRTEGTYTVLAFKNLYSFNFSITFAKLNHFGTIFSFRYKDVS